MGVAKTAAGASSVPVKVEGADEEDVRDITDDQRQAFLEYVEKHGRDPGYSVNKACRAVRIRRKDVRALFASDPDFDEDYQTAQGRGAEQILSQMVKLAIEGVEEPIASGGAIVGHKRVYSERLLQTMFSALTPEGKSMVAGKLGLEISGPGGGPIKVMPGVSLGDVAQALAEAGVDFSKLGLAAAPAELEEAPAGEVIAEIDEPA